MTTPIPTSPKAVTKEQSAILDKFIADTLPGILSSADHDELFGHQLTSTGTYHSAHVTRILMTKFLRANKWNAEDASKQLTAALKWRKEFNPLSAAFLEKHDPELVNLGYVTKIGHEVVTWNIYGSMQRSGLLKGENFDKFVRYRVGLMERCLQLLDFEEGEEVFLSQVHDYEGVSLLKFDKDTGRASKAIVTIFSDYYPETLAKKFFVNVPVVMYWIYELAKTWLPEETTKKFKMISNGGKLAKLYETHEEDIPQKYGGKNGKSLGELNLVEVKMTEYSTFLLEEKFTNELD